MFESRFRNLLVVLLFGLLTFLFFKTRFLNVSEHDRYTNALRQVKEEDSELNQDILKISYSILRSYDSVVARFSTLRELDLELRQMPEFLGAESVRILSDQLDQYAQLVEEKNALFQQFRRANVRLRNSLGYLPVLSSELTQRVIDIPSRISAALLRDLERDVLLFVLYSDADVLTRVRSHLQVLEQADPSVAGGTGNSPNSLLAAHVLTIAEFRPELDRISAELLSMPTGDRLEILRQTYDGYYRDAIQQANRYRGLLYALSLVLFLWGGFTFFRLRQTSAELISAKEGLEQNVAHRTRELAGSQARNRALLDAIPDLMLRISSQGRILDVKASAEVPIPVQADELVGSEVGEFFPELMHSGQAFLERAIESRQPQHFMFDADRQGQTHHFDARVVVSGSEEVLFMVRDVSEQKRSSDRVARAQERSEKLLRNILPAEIADELKSRGSVDPRYYGDVSILATHFIGFSAATEELAAEELVFLLDRYFATFDSIVARYGLEKLKTVGDSYICVGGLPKRKPSHPVDTVLAGLEMVRAVKEMSGPENLADWSLGIGIHTGPVVAGVVGTDKFAFDVFGQSVRFCSRIEAVAEGNRLNLSADTYRRVKDFFVCTLRESEAAADAGSSEPDPTAETEAPEIYFVEGIQPALIDDPSIQPPPAFQQRYSIYFQTDPPSFPVNVNESGQLLPAGAPGRPAQPAAIVSKPAGDSLH